MSGVFGFDGHSVADSCVLQFPGAVKAVARLRAAQLAAIRIEQDCFCPGRFILAPAALYIHLLPVRELDGVGDGIQGRPTILPQEVRDVIFAKVRSYACDILDKLRELQVDLRANPAIFIGGGSILFRSFVEESPLVAHADFVTDPKANAIGYGMLATAQLRRMAPQNYGGEFFAQG